MRRALVLVVVLLLTSSVAGCPGRAAPPASPPAGAPGATAGRPFDRAAAEAALAAGADAAREQCPKPGQTGGQGDVRVTFAPSGDVTAATIDAAWGSTPLGGCVRSAFTGLRVPPFDGAAVTLSRSVDIP